METILVVGQLVTEHLTPNMDRQERKYAAWSLIDEQEQQEHDKGEIFYVKN